MEVAVSGAHRTGKTTLADSYLASFEEIAENDFNLNLPRYVDTFEPEPEIDMAEVQADIVRINRELAEVEEKMDGYLKELGFKS